MARALYIKADIYLFDGIFDGLDATEKKEFFTRICLRELRQQTVMFTSNERSLARLSERIIVLNEGCIVEQGTIDELDKLGEESTFFQLTNADNVMGGKQTGMSKLMEGVDDAALKRTKLSDVTHATEARSQNTDELCEEATKAVNVQEDEVERINLIQILKRYLLPQDYSTDYQKKSGNELLIICGSVTIGIFADIWLGIWSSNVLGFSLSMYLFVYALLNIAQGGGILFRNLKVRFGLLSNGDKVHYTMIENMLRSTMGWFGQNPTPRIVGRFVGDTNTVDELLSETVISSVEALVCVVAGALIFNMFYLGFLVLITVAVLGYLFYALTLYFAMSSSFYQISMLHKNKMCRVLAAQMGSSVALRGYNKPTYLNNDFNTFCNAFQSTAGHLGKSGLCIGIRAFLCGVLLTFFIQAFPIFGLNVIDEVYSLKDFWQISMAIAWGLKTLGFMTMAINNLGNLSIALITVEKCYDWVDHPDIENTIGLTKYERDNAWAALEFDQVDALTDDKKSNTLYNCTFKVDKNKKIGLMGSSEGGKNEIQKLALSLKPVHRHNRNGGNIRIFGQSATDTDIYTIRDRTSSLFKEGKLFAGTVRENIDYHRTHITDEMIIKTLYWLKIFTVLNRDQKMKDPREETPVIADVDFTIPNKDNFEKFCAFITQHSMPNKDEISIIRNYLNSNVDPEGSNFEESQRKIILIARTLLKQPDILFMDDGCIDVPDLEDKYYVDALLDHQDNTTIVAVLNNFDYINRFDYLYWFQNGVIVEEGSPKDLIQKEGGLMRTSFKKADKKLFRHIAGE